MNRLPDIVQIDISETTTPRVSMTDEQRTLARRVADRVMNLPSQLSRPLNSDGDVMNMCSWGHSDECGTAACIAGWTVHLHDGPRALRRDGHDVSERAAALLGVEGPAASDLFVYGPCTHGLNLVEVTGAMAARVLHHLADHGEVSWRVALSEEEWAAREPDPDPQGTPASPAPELGQ